MIERIFNHYVTVAAVGITVAIVVARNYKDWIIPDGALELGGFDFSNWLP